MIEGTFFPTVMPRDFEANWISYDERDTEQKYLTDQFHEQIGEWGDLGLSFGEMPAQVIKEQDETDVLGELLLRIYQTSGSCVGCGSLTATMDSIIGDIIARGDFESVEIPFHLATYGVGRAIGGMRGRGEGSYGGAQAKAVNEFGFIYHDDVPNLPKPTIKDGWMWYPKQTEIAWSHSSYFPDGHTKESLGAFARKQQLLEFKRCRSHEDVMAAKAARWGVTVACNFGTRGCRVVSERLVAKWDASWAHQQSVGGYDTTTDLGKLFEINNQWRDAHGRCPLLWGKYKSYGSYWVGDDVIDRMCATGEVYAFTRSTGRPVDGWDWGNLGIKLAA